MFNSSRSNQSANDYAQIKDLGGPYDVLIASAAETHGVPYDLLHKQLFRNPASAPGLSAPLAHAVLVSSPEPQVTPMTS